MTGTKSQIFEPRRAAAKTYAELYGLYHRLHDGFGMRGSKEPLHGVMKDLIAIRNRVRREGE